MPGEVIGIYLEPPIELKRFYESENPTTVFISYDKSEASLLINGSPAGKERVRRFPPQDDAYVATPEIYSDITHLIWSFPTHGIHIPYTDKEPAPVIPLKIAKDRKKLEEFIATHPEFAIRILDENHPSWSLAFTPQGEGFFVTAYWLFHNEDTNDDENNLPIPSDGKKLVLALS